MSNLSIAKYFPFMRVKITKQFVHGEKANSAMVHLAPDRRYRPICHDCGQLAATVHSQGHHRVIRDLSIANADVWLQVEYRKVWCEHCQGVRVEQLSFAKASRRVTDRLRRYIYDLCQDMTVKEVAEHLDLDPKTVKQIDKEYLEEDFGSTDTENLRVLMIDEIAVRKGHSYLTVVANYFTGRLVWMGSERKKSTLDKFFAIMSQEQKERIEAVAMDMWEPFINRVKHHCPDAKIVFDFFHIVQSFGKVIDKVRRDEYLNASKTDQEILKGSRYLLLKNDENLTDDQRDRLQDVLDLNATLNALYILKDQLKLVYYYEDREKVKQQLDDWIALASQIKHPKMQAFIRKLRFFEYGIVNHADYPIGTSHLEGMNNKIKVIKRRAYGFHDDNYFALKVKQAFAA